jgi:hypothetical protein
MLPAGETGGVPQIKKSPKNGGLRGLIRGGGGAEPHPTTYKMSELFLIRSLILK